MPFIEKISIRRKIMLSFVLLIAIVMLTNLFIIESTVSKRLTGQLLDEGITTAKSISSHATDVVLAGDIDVLTSMLFDEKLAHKSISYIVVLNDKNEILAHTFTNDNPMDFEGSNYLPEGKDYNLVTYYIKNTPVYDIAVPLSYELGFLRVGYNKGHIDDAVRSAIFSILILSIFAILFAILAALFLTKMIIKPIAVFQDSAINISKGELGTKIEIHSKDEIGELAKTFNTMAAELQKSKNAIEAHSAELEEKVTVRTLQLDNKIKEMEESKIAILNMMEDVDMTNRNLIDAQAQLEKYVGELNVLGQKKDEFISIAAHELKTPLTSIRGFADLLQKPDISNDAEKRNKFFGIIKKETARLGNLITDILDLSRVDLGTLKFNLEEIQIPNLIEKIKEQMDVIIRQKGINPSYSVEENLPRIVVDEGRIVQVISNLINNAVHYTDSGGRIDIKVYRKDDYIYFSVSDTGLGIPKEYHDKLFHRFYQIDSSYTRKIGGSGLGLAICKEIVEALGGTIWFESEEGKGSTFYFTLPIKREVEKNEAYFGLSEQGTETERILKELKSKRFLKLDYKQIISSIIKSAEKLLGPMAIAAANHTQGLEVDKEGNVLSLSKDEDLILSELVNKYEKAIGPIGRLIADRELKEMLKEKKIIEK